MIKKKWEKFGRENPYYAVVTLDKFDNQKMNDEVRDEFFKTGYEYIERIWSEIEINFESDFAPEKALDFGCGVGRLVFPIAERAKNVVGIDISEKMLETAEANAGDLNFENVEFFQTGDFFEKNTERFDLIHSTIVFQHIKPKTGLDIFERLVGFLNKNGMGVVQFVYENPSPKIEALRFKFYRDIPVLYRIRNFIKKSRQPLFPMYEYDLNKIFSILQKNDCHKCLVNFSFHGMNGVVIYFQKKEGYIY